MRAALRQYWNVTFIPSVLFQRDKLLYTIDGQPTKIRMDADEVLQYIGSNRLDSFRPKN
jgi:hypothetical protein